MYCVILVTTKDKQEAEKIVGSLLDEKLIACGNIIDKVDSIFSWKGKVERAEESLLILKTRQDLFEEVKNKVKLLHSYEVPEIISLPVLAGSEEYLGWINDNVNKQ